TNGLAVALDEVEKMTAGIDHDRSWALSRGIGDNRACEGGIRPPRWLRCRREDVRHGGPACAGSKCKQRRAGHSLPDPHSPKEHSTVRLFHKDILNRKWPGNHQIGLGFWRVRRRKIAFAETFPLPTWAAQTANKKFGRRSFRRVGAALFLPGISSGGRSWTDHEFWY